MKIVVDNFIIFYITRRLSIQRVEEENKPS